MSARRVADLFCQYFGGAYDPTTHTYRTPQITVANMDGPIVRRAAPKRDDHASDYTLGTAGIPIGCATVVLLERGVESRAAVAGATSGVKQIRWTVRMHNFLRAASEYAETVQDAQYDLLDAIRAKLEADRTCGTGGFEAGYGVGFQVGEGGEPWIRWEISPVMTTPKDLSKGYVLVEFDADEYIQA
jgi:hypothetical protein